jgi:hypothetical protein|tara:strand:- start:2157 stop:3203 length:1047 start_codon:yes stop_codon:yes gene_type:complete
MKTITKGIVAAAIAVGASGTVASAQDKTFNISPNTALTFYGFIRAEAFYDLDFEQGDLSLTSELDSLDATDGSFDTSVRTTRFGFRLASETDIGTIGGQLEYDLFGSGGTAELRLRHANISVAGFTIGQTWTNFMPIGHYPTSLDFNGPVGVTFARVPQVRYASTAGNLDYSFSLEQSPGTSNDPVLTAATQYNGENYSVRIAGLAGTLENGANDVNRSAVTLSGNFKPWQGGSFGATYVNGEGIGDYLIGGGSSIVGGEANGTEGYTLEFRQDLGEKWNVGIAYGNEQYDAAGARDISELETIHVSAIYKPVDNIAIGFEYITGERTSGTGTTLEADRIGTSVTFRF